MISVSADKLTLLFRNSCKNKKYELFVAIPYTSSSIELLHVAGVFSYSRVDTDVLLEVAYSCNFLAVSDSSTCPDIGTS